MDSVQAKLDELRPNEPPYTEEFKRLWVESAAPEPCEIAKPGTVCLPMDSPLRRDIENQWWVNPNHLNIAGCKHQPPPVESPSSLDGKQRDVVD